MKIEFNKQIICKDFDIDFVVVNDNEYVKYTNVDDNVVIYNNVVNVYDKDNDNVVNVYDNDNVFNSIIKNIDNIVDNKQIKTYYQSKDLLNKVNDFDLRIKQINDDIVLLKDFDNINKYINVVDFVNDKDIKKLINDIVDDDNVFVLKAIDKDFEFDKDFVLLSLNKDLFKDNEFDFNKYIDFAYVVYNYDNDNVKVIVDFKNLDFVLNNFNYDYMTLSNKLTYNFKSNQLTKTYNQISNNEFEFKRLCQLKQSKAILKKQSQILKNTKGLQNKLITLKNDLNVVGYNKFDYDKDFDKFNVFELNLKEYNMIKQYIIKNNCYFDGLNDLKNIVFKSFKNLSLDFIIKDLINDIDKDKVNDFYKYDFDFDNDDNVFDFDIDKDFDIEFDDNDNEFVDNDFDDKVKDYLDKANKVLKDISYNLIDNVNLSIINDLNFDINKYYVKYNENLNILLDNVKDLKSIDINVGQNFNFLSFKNFDDITKVGQIIINDFFKYLDIVNDLKLYLSFLNELKDFLNELNQNQNNYSYFDKENTIYEYNIFKSPMNKHNTIIKKEQSDFLKVAFNFDENQNEFDKDFYYTE